MLKFGNSMNRSPEVDMEKNNGSRKDSERRQVEEKPLLTNLSKMKQLEAERALAAKEQNKSLCPDISDNKGLCESLFFFLVI